MSKLIAICQPHYIPWIGYFEMIDRVDEFTFLDDVDFIKREWKNRNRIRLDRSSAETKWLSVPIERASQRGTHIATARIASDVDWRRRHLDSVRHVYGQAPHFDDAYGLLETAFARPSETLGDLNIGLLTDTCEYLGIQTPLRRASDHPAEGRKTEKLLNLCLKTEATAYLANNGSAGYLELARFEEAGIDCRYQDYEHPIYGQDCGGVPVPFVSHLSIIDLIASCGPDALAVIRSGRPTQLA